MRVLIIDDSWVNLKFAETLFRQLGFDVTALSKGAEAIEACKNQCFDLVVTDYQMPEIDGLDVVRAIRDDEDLNKKDAVIIFGATTDQGTEINQAFLKAGAHFLVEKPLSLPQLKSLTSMYFGIRQKKSA